MEEINDLEEYSKFIEMLVTVTATDSQLMDFMQEEKDYKENLQLIRALLTDRSYSSLLTPADWQKILNFVGDCRYTMPNITEEQFLACNQMIGTINEYMRSCVKTNEYATYISDIAQTLVQVWSPKKRKLLKQEQQKFAELILDYYHSAYIESVFLDEVLINEYVNCFELSKSLVNENILLSLLCGLDVNFESILYVIQSPLTPYALTRILNFFELEGEEILLFENMIQAANEYIKTGTATIQIYGSTDKIQVDENVNDYSNILKNNSYEKLTSYLHQQYNQEQKKLEKR